MRDTMAEQAAMRADRAAMAMTTAMDGVTDRIIGRVLAKLRGPRARKGTRHWTEKSGRPSGVEVKALDGDYVVPGDLVDGVEEAVRPVMLRVTRDAALDTGDRLGGEDFSGGMFAVDEDLLAALVDDAMADLLGAADRYVTDVRQAVLDLDDTGMALDDLLETVEQQARGKAGRLRTDARTLGTALAAVAELEQARSLGAATMQWISRRDERVRHTHRVADGQQREIGEPFTVGRFKLEYPGDPSGLPATAGEVMGCRCGLLFARPDARVQRALAATAAAEAAGSDPPGVSALYDSLDELAAAAPTPDAPLDGPFPVSEVTLDEPLVGWRLLTVDGPDLSAGQRVRLPAGTELGLASPESRGVASMSVLLPVGTVVRVADGVVTLVAEAATSVLAVSAAGLQLGLL